jgi:hypothetical protein
VAALARENLRQGCRRVQGELAGLGNLEGGRRQEVNRAGMLFRTFTTGKIE